METEDLAIVGSVGLDSLGGDQVLVSLEIVNTAALAQTLGQGQATNTVAWVVREQAHTALQAIHAVQNRVPKRIYMGQINSIVFGQELARRGVTDCLDYFRRQNEIRRTLLVVTCETGSGLLQRTFVNEIPSRVLSDVLRFSRFSGVTASVTLNEFLRRLYEPGIEPIATHCGGRRTEDVYVERQGETSDQIEPAAQRGLPLKSTQDRRGLIPPEGISSSLLKEHGTAATVKPITVVLGLGVFRGDRLQGYLDGTDARGYLWVLGRPKKTLLESLHPTPDIENVGLESMRIDSSWRPVINGDTVQKMQMEITVQADIAFLVPDMPITPDIIRDIERAAALTVKQEIEDTLEIVQRQFMSDIYGFGQSVYRSNPVLWMRLEDDWNLKHFPQLPVEVMVSFRIRSATGLLHVVK